MDADEFDQWIRVSRMRGWAAACAHRYDYGGELRASLAATSTAARGLASAAYPCGHCAGWHIGPEITPEERSLL